MADGEPVEAGVAPAGVGEHGAHRDSLTVLVFVNDASVARDA